MTERVRGPRVFTIPAGAPYLDTLVAALLGGKLVPGFDASAGPLALAGATIYVPTRRSGRALAACRSAILKRWKPARCSIRGGPTLRSRRQPFPYFAAASS